MMGMSVNEWLGYGLYILPVRDANLKLVLADLNERLWNILIDVSQQDAAMMGL